MGKWAWSGWDALVELHRTRTSTTPWRGPLAESVLLGNVPLRVQLRDKLAKHPLLWDSAKLRFTNMEEANQFIRREYRAGWTL